MTLSLTEAATVLGKTPRQVRYMIRQGRLAAHKVGGNWRIESTDLPLTEAQRRALEARTQSVRQAMDEAFAPVERAVEKTGRRYSVRDLRAFRAGEAIYRDLVARFGDTDAAAIRLRAALEHVCQGCHAYRREDKAARFSSARYLAAAAVTRLLLGDSSEGPGRAELAERIEQSFMSDLSGLIRATERTTRRDRFDRFGASSAGV